MRRIYFIKEPTAYWDNAEFVAFLPKVNGQDELHSKLSEVLRFPDYYGDNWNALYDCLRDFNWIEKEGIVLVHTELPNLPNEDLKVYVDILFDAMQDWKEGEGHYFKVIFPEESETIIIKMKNIK